MTRDRPQDPETPGGRLDSVNSGERLDAGPDFGDVSPGEAARRNGPSPKRPTDVRARPPGTRPPLITFIGVVLALAVIGGVIFAGVKLIRSREPARPTPMAEPTGSASAAATPAAAPQPPLACGVPASLLNTMPVRQKLAQLLMVGVTDAADARQAVNTEHVGGIFIASWTDLTMLRDGELTAIGRSAGPLGLAVSVDEEGGRVERLSSLIGSSLSARELARTDSPEAVYQLAKERGQKMHDRGITIDFAPVVDVTDAPADTVIGDRSFSNDPAKVTKYAGEYARGLRDGGVLPVLKHFPGHGRASGDSHTGWVVTPSLDELKKSDLDPYRTLLTQRPVAVMLGHMQVPGLTGNDPASLSPSAVDLLRKGSGYGGPPFDGAVFTDDLSTMKAITERYSVPEAVLKALQAGVDTALWVSTKEVPDVLNRLEAALKNGELSAPMIDASVRRMANAKALSNCGG